MNISELVPSWPPEGKGDSCAGFITALAAAAHLERSLARALGWRGLRPCMATGHAWTCRAVSRPGVYGLAFMGEELYRQGTRGEFSLFYFPEPGEGVLARYPREAAGLAAQEDYFSFIREFSSRDEAAFFHVGAVGLDLRADGEGLALSLEAPARIRAALIAEDDAPEKDVYERDIPALRLALPLFGLLANTMAHVFAEEARFYCAPRRWPLPAVDGGGEWGIIEGQTLPGAVLRADLGAGGFGGPESAFSADENGRDISGGPGGPGSRGRMRPLGSAPFRPQGPPDQELEKPVLHMVCGFLGSGKTTFISEWLAWLHNHERYTAVLQNEFGAKGLDAALLAEETPAEALDEGCVCCTLAESLRPAVRRLRDSFPTTQIILETTGLANPFLVLEAVRELGDLARPGLRISLVDALDLKEKINSGENIGGLAAEQIRHADVLILNKVDAVGLAAIPMLQRKVREINSGAVLLEASHGRIPFGLLDQLTDDPGDGRTGCRAGGRASNRAGNRANNQAVGLPEFSALTHHNEGFSSLTMAALGPVRSETLEEIAFMSLGRVARIKGVVDLAEEGKTVVVQYAASRLTWCDAPPRAGAERFLVLIGRDMDDNFIREISSFSEFSLLP